MTVGKFSAHSCHACEIGCQGSKPQEITSAHIACKKICVYEWVVMSEFHQLYVLPSTHSPGQMLMDWWHCKQKKFIILKTSPSAHVSVKPATI